METRRWTNPGQPQTLQIAVFLLYAEAFFNVLYTITGVYPALFLLVAAAGAAAGNGIANEHRWGYGLGVAMAFLPFLLRLAFGVGAFSTGLINLMFEIALIARLLHAQSRDYQRIWFK